MRIDCPYCGLRDSDEFYYGGDAVRQRPTIDNDDSQAWYEYVFLRDNPRGLHREHWQHHLGCREWLLVTRDTLTHEITAVEAARTTGGDTIQPVADHPTLGKAE